MNPDYTLHCGDCLEVLPTLDGMDACVCDPPYGLSFMGKGWDHGVPGVPYWEAVMKACKPGAHLLAFGGTRTFHRLAVAIEDAGWEIRDTVMWVYGSGFPKSLDVSKGIDREAGAQREVVGVGPSQPQKSGHMGGLQGGYVAGQERFSPPITAPATDAAKQWAGWGTALKPAWEPILVARKPLEGTVAENVLKHGTGGINVNCCRVGKTVETWPSSRSYAPGQMQPGHCGKKESTGYAPPGRWPANVIHDGSAEVLAGFPVTGASKATPRNNGEFKSVAKGRDLPHVTLGHDDAGGSAARFFYCAKASRSDRNEGCEGLEERTTSRMNTCNGSEDDGEAWHPIDERTGEPRDRFTTKTKNFHPMVKPTTLMRYLCKLVTPPGGLILDPFMGSGSTGKAAILEGFRFIGIDKEAEYVRIAEARIQDALKQRLNVTPGLRLA